MSDQKMLITKIIRTDTTRADLYAKGHQYRDAILFDISDLADVGIDYERLSVGVETPCRFWAHFELSPKENQNGNPYKDIVLLEPVAPSVDPLPQAAATAATDPAILAELRAIRAVLVAIAETLSPAAVAGQLPAGPKDDPPALDLCPTCHTRPCICDKINDSQDPATSSPDPEPPTTYADGSAINDNDAERVAFRAHVAATSQAPADVAALRAWVKATMPAPE